MKTYYMDLEFLCDKHEVYEEDIIAICILSHEDNYEYTSYIKPYDEAYEVTEYCTELTGIREDDLIDKPYFDEVYEVMLDNIMEEDLIYVWGDVDLEAIYKMSMEIAGQLEFKIMDLQEEIMKDCGYKFRPGLKKVYQALTNDFEIVHHDVKNDTLMLKTIDQYYKTDKKSTIRKIKGKIK